jgi:hypothetical protein
VTLIRALTARFVAASDVPTTSSSDAAARVLQSDLLRSPLDVAVCEATCRARIGTQHRDRRSTTPRRPGARRRWLRVAHRARRPCRSVRCSSRSRSRRSGARRTRSPRPRQGDGRRVPRRDEGASARRLPPRGTVTVTHTAGVFALGFVTLGSRRSSSPSSSTRGSRSSRACSSSRRRSVLRQRLRSRRHHGHTVTITTTTVIRTTTITTTTS